MRRALKDAAEAMVPLPNKPGETYAAYQRRLNEHTHSGLLHPNARCTTLPLYTTGGPPPDVRADLDETATIIEAREVPYGNFEQQCKIIEEIMHEVRESPNWWSMACDQREAVHMIVVKLSRILNGDHNHKDSWADIAGYAKLISGRLTYDR